MKKITFLFITLFSVLNAIGQMDTIEVAVLKIKVSSKKHIEFIHKFAKGDQIVFNFEEINKKPLTKFKIYSYGNYKCSSPIFLEYKVVKIENKSIKVLKESKFIFQLTNDKFSKRICKLKIYRIPESEETKDFNTNY